jgi:hypothetical protein
VSIGNWGDEERTAELGEFLIEPVAALSLSAPVHGVRYPPPALAALAAAGIDFAGYRLLEARVPSIKRSGTIAAFWDVDAPVTLDRLAADPGDPFRALIPAYDVVSTYGGGPPVVAGYRRFGARSCVPILNYSYRGDLAADRQDVADLPAVHGFQVERSGTHDFALWDGATFLLRR